MCLYSFKLLVLSPTPTNIYISFYLLIFLLFLHWNLFDYFQGFFAESVRKTFAPGDILKHLASSGQDVLSQESGKRNPREDIIILLHLPYEKLPTEAHKQTNPYSIPLLADLATGIQKEQIMESKKRM